MTFQRPASNVAAALEEWDRLVRADLADVLETRAVASMMKRATMKMKPLARVKAIETAREVANSKALAGTVSVIGAVLGDVVEARSIGDAHAVSARAPGRGKALEAARNALAERGYEPAPDRWWHREIDGRRLASELKWLAAASFLPREG